MATYRGKKVSLNKVMRGDVKKFKVFVKKGKRVVKVNFGDKSMKIKKNIRLVGEVEVVLMKNNFILYFVWLLQSKIC